MANLQELTKENNIWQTIRSLPILPIATIVLLLFVGIFAPLISPYPPLDGDLDLRNANPSWLGDTDSPYFLGGDHIGRDILTRIIYGTRISLMVAGTVLVFGTLVGTVLGLLSGYIGGLLDEFIMRLVDFMYAVPFILVVLVCAVLWSPSLMLVIILLSIFTWPPFARQVRAETLTLKEMDYVSLAKVSGSSGIRICINHILPGLFNTVMVMASLQVGSLVVTESVLSFLGVGIPAPAPTWGSMVSEGRNYISTAWWISFFPGIAILLIVFSMNFLGDWLRDRLDPRLRQI
jgi:peptide/nickel transport system permease protein|tara:strand:- start:858 stop:1730 length:873 start_codon:yes stop_codon:yes gene_type:complete